MSWNIDKQHVVVTGATSGIGLATVTELAKQGAYLYLLVRNKDKAQQVVNQIISETGNSHINLIMMDMMDLNSVKAAADQLIELQQPFSVLINNAGVVNTKRILTQQGHEAMFGVNHLAHFLLTTKLLPILEAQQESRIITVSSAAHSFYKMIRFNDLSWTEGFSTLKAYGHSKLANIFMTRELTRRLTEQGKTHVHVYALHPGAVSTALGAQNGWAGKVLHLLLKPFFRTPLQGASSSIYLATAEQVAGRSGDYFYNKKVTQTKPWAENEEQAQKLWQVSEKLINV